ncbi:hypothetical protein PoB_004312700 [Plakobranchus ocellatus]|uniref:Uncharacterized protein n=1 Tax=Plakobranchus ocellatus TaxID=259542 RepID=A0AAV4BCE7_9GAST|nr:hypothetical protein PoB_004312700 [Plakobranchus ocellatus]
MVEYSNRNSNNSSINGNKIKIGSCSSNISSSNTISSSISNSSGIDNSNTSTCGGNGMKSIESQTAAASTAAYSSSNYTSSSIRISSSMDNGNTITGGGNKPRGSIVWNHKQQQHLQLRAPAALAAAIFTSSNIRISSSTDNGITSTGSGTNSSTQVESTAVASAKE